MTFLQAQNDVFKRRNFDKAYSPSTLKFGVWIPLFIKMFLKRIKGGRGWPFLENQTFLRKLAKYWLARLPWIEKLSTRWNKFNERVKKRSFGTGLESNAIYIYKCLHKMGPYSILDWDKFILKIWNRLVNIKLFPEWNFSRLFRDLFWNRSFQRFLA